MRISNNNIFRTILRRLAISLAAPCIIASSPAAVLAQVTPGIDFNTDATFDTDADDRWEDTTVGNPSTFDFFLDVIGPDAVTRNTGVSAGLSGIDAAYDFVGGATGNAAGAELSDTGGATVRSFQEAPGNWSDENVSFELWFKPASLVTTPTNGHILFEDGGGTGMGLFMNDDVLRARKLPGGLEKTRTITGAEGTEFIQAVVTFNRGPNPDQMRLFVNGAEVGAAAAADNGGDWTGGDAFGLGTRGEANVGGLGSGQQNTESFDGEISILRVYRNQLLTPTQVLANFNAVASGVFFDDGGAGTDWGTAANWLGDTEPSAADQAFINGGLTATLTAAGKVASSVSVGSPDGGGGAGTFNVSGGDLTITNNFQLGGNLDTVSNLRGTVTQTGGSVSVGGDLVFGGAAGTEGGTYNLNAGTLTVTGDIVETTSNVDNAQLHLNGGTLAMPNGATTSSIVVQRFSVGETTGTNVTYTANAPITTTGTLAVGGFSNAIGDMTIDDSSFPVNAANASLGQGDTADGTLTVEGTGIFNVTAGDFHIGGDATGGADSGTSGDFILNAGGTVTVSGGNTEVGTGGTGTFTQNGGSFTQLTNNFVVAVDGASTGTVDINGGTVTATGTTKIGDAGQGSVDISGSGTYTFGNIIVGEDNVGTAVGELTIEMDNASDVINTAQLRIGVNGKGTVNLVEGTLTMTGGDIRLADAANATTANGRTATLNIGRVAMDTDPTLNVVGNLENGDNGDGIVNMYSGTVNMMSNNNWIIGQTSTGTAEFNLFGGTVDLTVGSTTNGILKANQGDGVVNMTGGAIIARDIEGANNAAGSTIYNFDGGVVTILDNLDFRNLGTDTVNLAGATLDLTGGDVHVGDRTGTNVFSFTGGTLKDVNIFNGNLTQANTDAASILQIGGDNAVDTMTLAGTGAYDLQGGTLAIDIFGTGAPGTAYDQLLVNTTAMLAGDLDVSASGLDSGDVSQTFTILDAATLSGTFNGLSDGATLFASIYVFQINYNPALNNNVVLTLVNIVPEPSSFMLSVLGLFGLALGARRRRRRRRR